MKVQMDVESKSEGKICIPGKILIDSLKNLPEQPLTINVDKNFGIEITSDTGKYKLMGENPDNFPKEPLPDETHSLTMPSELLMTAISKTLFCVSTDDLRPAMSGVYFELEEDGELKFVATDAHRLVLYKRNDVSCPSSNSFIVPKKPLSQLKNILPETSEEITLSFNENHLFIQYGTSHVICRLIDARFPDYKVVIPNDNPYALVINRVQFQNALRRLSVFSNKSTYLVVLNVSGSELQLTSQDVDLSFEGNERMNCQYDGEDLQIAFNARFLIEMLSATESEEIKMELSTPTRPGILKPLEQNEGEDLLMLLMPLMIN
jgi:DNA polymerase-3 subunit beta